MSGDKWPGGWRAHRADGGRPAAPTGITDLTLVPKVLLVLDGQPVSVSAAFTNGTDVLTFLPGTVLRTSQ